MGDPRIDFLASLNLDETRVKNFPGFVFICGGPVPKDEARRPFQSLRHQLLEHVKATKTGLGAPHIVAESFSKWLEFGTYDDLITFERHLTGLANLVPIILESAGSIAEFGAFSQEATIKAKLLVFRGDHFAGDESFINFGLVKFLEQENDGCIQTYPWADKTNSQPDEIDARNAPIVADIADYISDRVTANLQKTHKFRSTDHGDVMVLIEDLIKLMIGLRLDEIVEFLKHLGIDANKKTVNQYLFLLRNVHVIGDQHYGSRFYFSQKLWKTHIDYAFKASEKPFDRGAFMRSLEEYYRSRKDKRLNASLEFTSSIQGEF